MARSEEVPGQARSPQALLSSRGSISKPALTRLDPERSTTASRSALPSPFQGQLAPSPTSRWGIWDRLGEHEGGALALMRLPRELHEHLPAALERARSDLAPCSDEDILIAAAMLGALPSKAMSEAEAKAAVGLLRLGLDDMPADLLALAVRRAARTCRFRPAPAELRELVADEWAERRRRLHRLEASRAETDPAEPYCTPAEAAAIIAEFLGSLSVPSVKEFER